LKDKQRKKNLQKRLKGVAREVGRKPGKCCATEAWGNKV
jgi:hypothetical protein